MDKAKIIDNIDKELQKMGVYIQADHRFLIVVILHAAGYFEIVEAAKVLHEYCPASKDMEDALRKAGVWDA